MGGKRNVKTTLTGDGATEGGELCERRGSGGEESGAGSDGGRSAHLGQGCGREKEEETTTNESQAAARRNSRVEARLLLDRVQCPACAGVQRAGKSAKYP